MGQVVETGRHRRQLVAELRDRLPADGPAAEQLNDPGRARQGKRPPAAFLADVDGKQVLVGVQRVGLIAVDVDAGLLGHRPQYG